MTATIGIEAEPEIIFDQNYFVKPPAPDAPGEGLDTTDTEPRPLIRTKSPLESVPPPTAGAELSIPLIDASPDDRIEPVTQSHKPNPDVLDSLGVSATKAVEHTVVGAESVDIPTMEPTKPQPVFSSLGAAVSASKSFIGKPPLVVTGDTPRKAGIQDPNWGEGSSLS